MRPASSRNHIPSDHVGPMARTIEDLAVVLDAIAGHDPADPQSLRNAPTDHAARFEEGVKGLRIGVPRELMEFPLQAGVAAAFEAAKEAFRELGADVREISVPPLARASIINNAIVPPETAAQHLHWAETWFKAKAIRYGEDVATLLAMGRAVPATDFFRASRERKALSADPCRAVRNRGRSAADANSSCRSDAPSPEDVGARPRKNSTRSMS